MTVYSSEVGPCSTFKVTSRGYAMNHWRGAAACCQNENHEILMVLQGKPDEKFKWSVPSGGIETGETFEECCVREVWEETGYKVKVTEKLFEKRGQSYGWNVEVHYYLVIVVSGAACLQDPDGLIHEVAWKSGTDIVDLDLSFPEDREFLMDLTSPHGVSSVNDSARRESE